MSKQNRKLVIAEQVTKLENDFYYLYEENGKMRDELSKFYREKESGWNPLDEAKLWFRMCLLALVVGLGGQLLLLYHFDAIDFGGNNVERIEADGRSGEVESERPPETLDKDED